MKYRLDLIAKNMTRKRPAFENLFLKERKKATPRESSVSPNGLLPVIPLGYRFPCMGGRNHKVLMPLALLWHHLIECPHASSQNPSGNTASFFRPDPSVCSR
jgi:hypothetical protein